MPMLPDDPTKPRYCELPDDGAPYRCKECGQAGPHHTMYFIQTPNGATGTYHKTCLEPDWLARATLCIWKD